MTCELELMVARREELVAVRAEVGGGSRAHGGSGSGELEQSGRHR